MQLWKVGRALFIGGIALLVITIVLILIAINNYGWQNDVMTAALIMGGVAILLLFVAVIIAIISPDVHHHR